MKQPTLFAMLFILSPFALCAQEEISAKHSYPAETLKEKISASIMKTTPIQPVVMLTYTEGEATMNLTHKEQLKMRSGNAASTPASSPGRVARKASSNSMNLSPKEKMRMGL